MLYITHGGHIHTCDFGLQLFEPIALPSFPSNINKYQGPAGYSSNPTLPPKCQPSA